jgi:hypothetical protein
MAILQESVKPFRGQRYGVRRGDANGAEAFGQGVGDQPRLFRRELLGRRRQRVQKSRSA